jgi:hypothetical protein
LDQDHKAKRHKDVIHDIQQESLKETPPNLPHGNSKKRLRKSPKMKNGRNHAESSIHIMKGLYKVLLPPDHPSLSQDLTMKL